MANMGIWDPKKTTIRIKYLRLNFVKSVVMIILHRLCVKPVLCPLYRCGSSLRHYHSVSFLFMVGDMYTCPRARATGQMPIMSRFASRGSCGFRIQTASLWHLSPPTVIPAVHLIMYDLKIFPHFGMPCYHLKDINVPWLLRLITII